MELLKYKINQVESEIQKLSYLHNKFKSICYFIFHIKNI